VSVTAHVKAFEAGSTEVLYTFYSLHLG
jgi:hypothetical protein